MSNNDVVRLFYPYRPLDDAFGIDNFGRDWGVVHEAIVTGRKVMAGPKFWAKLAHDEDLFEKVVRFVAGDGKSATAKNFRAVQKYVDAMGTPCFLDCSHMNNYGGYSRIDERWQNALHNVLARYGVDIQDIFYKLVAVSKAHIDTDGRLRYIVSSNPFLIGNVVGGLRLLVLSKIAEDQSHVVKHDILYVIAELM